MKKMGLTLMLAALVALATVATAAARSDSAAGSSVTAVADDHGSGSGHDAGDDHGNHAVGNDDDGHYGDDDGDRREAGEDVRGNCDEAEHANDAACLATATTTKATTTATTSSNTVQSRHKSSRASARRLVATVGSGFTITLKTPAGAAVKTLAAGTYTVTVRDRSEEHNFHLSGRGVNKTTSVDAVSTSTWQVRLAKGTYTFTCDPHAQVMRGSVRVV